jgi:hypothetical protein
VAAGESNEKGDERREERLETRAKGMRRESGECCHSPVGR